MNDGDIESNSLDAANIEQMSLNLSSNEHLGENCYANFVIATPEKVIPIYSKFKDQQVIVEGPERSLDLTYFLVSMCEDLGNLEQGIPIDKFKPNDRKVDMEFRILDKMTFHKDHVANLFVSSHSEFKVLNRHLEVLPFKHNRVILKGNPSTISNEDGDEEKESL